MHLRHLLISILASLLLCVSTSAKAEHIVGGEIYWECITVGPDAGKFIFYLKLYRDCSVSNTVISGQGHSLIIPDHPDWNLELIDLYPISEQDISDACGVSCETAWQGDISIREYVFATNPMTISGVPPANGWEIVYHRCCRNSVDNLVNANNTEIYYSATMYPYEGRNLNPCYDSSPNYAETPVPAVCSGGLLRYSGVALDVDLDSLSYEFVPSIGTNGLNVSYESGYSYQEPLPGPSIDSSYESATINPVSGLLEYDSPPGIQGRWAVAMAVDSWRCGQRISRITREMSLTIIPCTEENNLPVAEEPVWLSPLSADGYEVTVLAGDEVSFTLEAHDFDLVGIQPQEMTFNAMGSQFGLGFTNPNAGCENAPCATLSSVIPPVTVGDSTLLNATFNWQTTCDHVVLSEGCANASSTYNFMFKFSDNFCPINGVRMLNVAVTVVGEPIIASPVVRCASFDSIGDVSIFWEPTIDTNTVPSFVEYVIEHSFSETGPYTQIGAVANIETGLFIHELSNPVVSPSQSTANYYRVRTRSGCNDQMLEASNQTISTMHLTLDNPLNTTDLSWNAVSEPLPTSAETLYRIYREYPLGTWSWIASTVTNSYSDTVVASGEQVNYRIELADNLPCVSRSNVVGYVFDGTDETELLKTVDVYPNPNNGLFEVRSPSVSIHGYAVIDLSGKIIQSEAVKESIFQIDLQSHLCSGTYILLLDTEVGSAARRIVVVE